MCHADSTGIGTPAVAQQEVEVDVGGEAMPATLYLPPEGTGPGIEVLSDVYGRLPFYQGLAAKLAQDGYVTLLPNYFFRQGPLSEVSREAAFARHSRTDEQKAVHDHAAAVSWLHDHRAVRGNRIGLLGFCLGGTFALDLCAERNDVAAVCYYAFPYGFGNPCTRKAPRPIELAEEITQPVLAHWGGQDHIIPVEEISTFGEAMRATGNPYSQHVYPEAGHSFLAGLAEGPPDSFAALESWKRSLDFFACELSR
ncbi:carboxymethylenebutenolidase [Saccharopolyspora lacisalsi]|uniref:Carboxymethylenebutenolidase n=1 Tax=Halosaccharopolyspora lacisalsi TaxID=1000566 RepID=A0A839DZ78_9PSEU|nr:dienelactone hydrolase family protein [Halosaccharopolyspora lacisalsi]MBA8824058.1 carboxymethylenebutenolidase [Halosaccharopolyspora lacisalsi]